jgi:periplasmic protein TonB
MDGVLEGTEHLERELAPEPIAGPATGSILLHVMLAVFLGYYAWILGLFHHNLWGNPGAGGSMQVSLVSSALPLPPHEINDNVLATETPSHAPAAPSPKEQRREDETAIPILGKKVKPSEKNLPKTQPHQQSQQRNMAQYGEQSGSIMPQQMQPGTAGPTTVGDNSFASLYPWYVDQINRKMSETWNKGEVDPRTPKGSRVYLIFSIHRDGSVSGLQLDRSSGSPSLDVSCERAVQRVDTFGSLPGNYNQSTLKVSYYCEY